MQIHDYYRFLTLNGFRDLPGDQIWDEKYNMTSSKAWYAKQNAFAPNLKSEIAQNPYVQYGKLVLAILA